MIVTGAHRVRLAVGEGKVGAVARLVSEAGHVVVDESPEVIVADPVSAGTGFSGGVPVIVLGGDEESGFAGILPEQADAGTLDAAVRAVALGLTVRPGERRVRDGGFGAAEDAVLTPREIEVLTLVGAGLSNKEVARRLGISAHTVKFHMEAAFRKLGAGSRAEAVAKGLRRGLIEV